MRPHNNWHIFVGCKHAGFFLIDVNPVPQNMLARLVDVQPQERGALLFSFAYFFCLLCAYYLLRPLRDALGLHSGAGQLPWLFTATFFAMLVLVPLFGAVATRWPPRKFVPYVYRFFTLNILGFGALFATGIHEDLVARVFFVWISVFNLFVVSIFWSVMADHFSNEQGRRLFGFIAAGGTAGALAGPALTASLVAALGPAALAVLAALLLELAVQCCARVTRSAAPINSDRFNTRLDGGIFAGITLILRDRYLLSIVLYLLLHTLASTFLYLEQGRIVADRLPDTVSRTRFFASVDLAVSCFAIVLQLAVTGRFLQRFGVVSALVLLPVISVIAIAGLALMPGLLMLGLAQGTRRAVDYAIVRPAREVLFTVVSRASKYKAKSVIETVVYRGGDAASGWLFAGLAALGIGFSGLAILFVPLAAAWTGLALRLGATQEERAGFPNRVGKGISDKRGFE
jgi:AAA family ATP:ADP antiporter